MRATLREQLDPGKLDGIISMHLIESDPALSKPITDDPPVSDPGAGDWFVLIDGTQCERDLGRDRRAIHGIRGIRRRNADLVRQLSI